MWTCHKCGKPVYFAERKQSLGYDWHPECLRCEECGKRLNPGQHAEHKGVPYCHVPCYGALFGPQLFGHGTRVESHTSFGKVENKSCGPNMPRSHLESKLKVYNQFFDGRSGEIRSREVNGRLVLEGALRIYWGVTGVIHLKEDDDQRTVVTIRKRNSCRHSNLFNGIDVKVFSRSSDESDMLSDGMSNSSSFDTGFSSMEATEGNSEAVSTTAEDNISNSDVIDSAVDSSSTSNSAGKCLTLPPKLDIKQIDWDELDELLQVERQLETNEKLYQTMPTALNLNQISDNCSKRNVVNSACNSSCNSNTDLLQSKESVSTSASGKDVVGSGSTTEEAEGGSHNIEFSQPSEAQDQDSYSQNFERHLEDGVMFLSPSSSIDNVGSNGIVHDGHSTVANATVNSSSDEGDDVRVTRSDEEDLSSAAVRRRKKGSTAIKRRSGAKRHTRSAKLKRRCSINGHFYNRETSFFTPPFGSQMSVWITSLVSTQEVINLMLDKYKVDSRPSNFALFVVRDNGEQRRLRDDEYPLLTRVTLGPHEDVAKLYLMDRHSTEEISCEVAQFLNLSTTECRAILERYKYEEEREVKRVKAKFREMQRRIKQRMEDLKVRL